MVIWIIGLSGAGKTTLANEVVRLARQRISHVALVDGDDLRQIWGNDLGYTIADRKKNAERLNRFCQYLDKQNIHAVAAVLSLFEESREWNRKHLTEYYEVFIRTPLEDMQRRDVKGLYAQAIKGAIELPGVNIPFTEPSKPDLVIKNFGKRDNLLFYAQEIAKKLF